MAGSVVAVCVVHQIRPDAGRVGRTAIDKRPVEGPVQVGGHEVTVREVFVAAMLGPNGMGPDSAARIALTGAFRQMSP